MKKKAAYIMIIVSVAAFAICALPLISADSGGSERFTIVIRGYNLVEFSAWGCVPILAPLIVPCILLGGQARAAQEAELIVLLLGNAVCYVHGFNTAREWLSLNSDSLIMCHPGMILYPFTFVVVLVLGKIFEVVSKRVGLPNYMEVELDDSIPIL